MARNRAADALERDMEGLYVLGGVHREHRLEEVACMHQHEVVVELSSCQRYVEMVARHVEVGDAERAKVSARLEVLLRAWVSAQKSAEG